MRRLPSPGITLLGVAILVLAPCPACPAAPLAEQYLLDGNLADGAKALQERLREDDKDDQARFGLGVTLFPQAFEHLGGSLRTEKSFLRLLAHLKEFLPQNPTTSAMPRIPWPG